MLDKVSYICTDVKYRLNGERLAATRHWTADEITGFLQDRDTVDVESTIYDRILPFQGQYALAGTNEQGEKPMDGQEAARFVHTIFTEEDITKNVLDVVTDGDGYGFNLRLHYDVLPDDEQAAVREKGETVISGDLPDDTDIETYLAEYENSLRATIAGAVPVEDAATLLRQMDEVTGTLDSTDKGIPLRLFDPDIRVDRHIGPEFPGDEAATDIQYLVREYDSQQPEVTVVPGEWTYDISVACDFTRVRTGARREHRIDRTVIYKSALKQSAVPDTIREQLDMP
jgi:hypothetical protein